MFINFSSSRPNFPVKSIFHCGVHIQWCFGRSMYVPLFRGLLSLWFHVQKNVDVCSTLQRGLVPLLFWYYIFLLHYYIIIDRTIQFYYKLRLKRFSFIISKYLYIYILTLGTYAHSLVCKQSVGSLPPFLNRRKFQWTRETDPHKFVVRWLKSLLPSNCTQTLVRVLRIPIRQRFFNRENSIIDL